jgi:hypothetical protein
MVTTAAKQVASKGRHLTHFGCTNEELFQRHVSRRSILEPRSYLWCRTEMYFWTKAIHLGAWKCPPKLVEEVELKAVLT